MFQKFAYCLAMITLTLMVGCLNNNALPLDNEKPLKTPFADLSLPRGWTVYDSTSLDLVPEEFKSYLKNQETVFLAADMLGKNRAYIYMQEKSVFSDFATLKEGLISNYANDYKSLQDYQLLSGKELNIGEREAIAFSSRYTRVAKEIDNEGQTTKVYGEPTLLEEIFINWPEGALTTLICESKIAPGAPSVCLAVAGSMVLKMPKPGAEAYLAGGTYKTADYSFIVPKNWYSIPKGLNYLASLALPPAIRGIYNPSEDVSLISPDTNFVITVTKVNLESPLDDDDALKELGGRIVESAAKNSKSAPQLVGLNMVNGLKQININNLSFSENSNIKTELIYVLNRKYATCFMCTYHEANTAIGQKQCAETASSLVFTDPPVLRPKYAFLGPINGKIASDYMAFTPPSSWQVQENKNSGAEEPGAWIQEFTLNESKNGIKGRLTLSRTPYNPQAISAAAVKAGFISKFKHMASLLGLSNLISKERLIGGYRTTWLWSQAESANAAGNKLIAVLINSGDNLFSATLLAPMDNEPNQSYESMLENLISSLELKENIRLLSPYQESRLVDFDSFSLLAPRKWFVLPPSLAPDVVNNMPPSVKRQYNGTSSALVQLIAPVTPDGHINSINVNRAAQKMLFTPESTKNLENQLAGALYKNYQNVKLLASKTHEIAGTPAFSSHWQSEINGGVLLYTLQTLVACPENTIIATCLFTAGEQEQIKQNCLETVATIRCK